jgi:hypothetical protein
MQQRFQRPSSFPQPVSFALLIFFYPLLLSYDRPQLFV